MTDRINGGSPVVCSPPYQTVPTAVIHGAQQRDRYPNRSELKELGTFLSTGLQRLAIAQVLAQYADDIVAAGAKRIFVGGNPMDYFEKPAESIGLPGSGYYVGEDYLSAKARDLEERKSRGPQVKPVGSEASSNPIEWVKRLFFSGKPSVPGHFQAINIRAYGPVRMKRSMRDLGWFLRYVSYAIVAGDTSIISVNTRGLRGVIPEDVTLATSVALREMQWKSLSYFAPGSAAVALVKQYFEVLIAEYQVEKPDDRLRMGVSKQHQGLQLPECYEESGSLQPRWVLKPGLSDMEKDEVIKAACRQVFERDVSALYQGELAALISRVKSGRSDMSMFIRQLGKSRLYRQLYYEPYSLSRSIELACRHFLGRGIICIEEFKDYFALVADRGFLALVDELVSSQEYADYFGEETVPYLRGLGLEAQACNNWGPQLDLFKYSAIARKMPQFITTFAGYQQPLPNQHPYGVGHDPLETQFGAIFPQENKDLKAQPAHFSEDSRRLLIHAPAYPAVQGSTQAVVIAVYRQLFGCDVLSSQHDPLAETQFRDGRITVRGLVRHVAKSKAFRRAYWETLYITKATEIIHRRLLGRPTYGRRETGKYYDICAHQGFYGLVDALLDSEEYLTVFGEDTVPYERYITPQGQAMRRPQGPASATPTRSHPVTVDDYMMSYRPAQDVAAPSSPLSQRRAIAPIPIQSQTEASTVAMQNGQQPVHAEPVNQAPSVEQPDESAVEAGNEAETVAVGTEASTQG
ncbi:MAG: phycobilisome rod-core linker polypeptide [Cyanobacteria bacterium J06606_4]